MTSQAPEPRFDRHFDPRHGEAVAAAPGVARVTAPNAGPLTFHGTNSYLVGTDSLAVIDPGPLDEAHFATLLRAIDGRPVTHVFVTHTHRDHSPLAARLASETGATIIGAGRHHAARPLHPGEINPLGEAADTEYAPDRALADGERVDGDGWALRAVATPGHTANHLAFALDGTGVLFSGDHVMAWATTVIAPPDGSMKDFMASLDRLLARDDRLMLPGHGGAVLQPRPFIRALKAHRRMRERAILERVRAGDLTLAAMVEAIYRDTDPRLHRAAAFSVFAHLEDLVDRGEVLTDGPPALDGRFRPA